MGEGSKRRIKRKKKSFGDRIYLEWYDACERTGWKSLSKALKISTEVCCRTAAFYLGETNDFVMVAHTIGKTKDNDVTGIIHIPKKWITVWE